MDTATLVSLDIAKGADILKILDETGVKVKVAMWVVLGEYGDWRFFLSGEALDTPDRRDAFALLRNVLAPAGFTERTTPPLLILKTTDPFVKGLRRAYRKFGSNEGIRIGGQLFGDRFIEDAYVYRIV